MMQKEIIEGNKLIAEFMDSIDSSFKWDGYKFTNDVSWIISEYHFSWDWLMPVIEKIETIKIEEYNINFSIMGKAACWTPSHWCGLKTYLADSKIEAVYIAVIEFIKWYNSNKKL
jgi:hypothetical protein